jgi:adenine-specific DNA-methyltransferase
LIDEVQMARSLLEELPGIVRDGRKEAERILESLESRHRVRLQTREWVLPSKDASAADWITQAERTARIGAQSDADWQNRLIYGDNLLAMAALLAGDDTTPSLRGAVDLIYIDPPFDSKADYRTKITLPGAELEQRPTVLEQFAYSDTWADGTASYLKMIVPRLVLMRELLADTGSIYVHLDWHVGHYVKLVMDEIFAKSNFVNEIIWKRQTAKGDITQGATHMGRIHDNIFLYGKSEHRTWNPVFTPYDDGYVEEFYRHKDVDGRRYQLSDITAPGGAGKGNPCYSFMGITRYWRFSEKRMQQLFEQGRIIQINPGTVPRQKRYLDEMPGIPLQDLWLDIRPVQSQARESIDYGTQKPEVLLERIIEASSNAGQLIADFNGGSGTTAAVAERLGRRWITSDLGKPACMIMRKRLIDQQAKPFLYQAIGDYQVEAAKSHLGRGFRVGDLSEIVLSLYGALPLPAEENPLRNLGQVVFGGRKTLVLADSPNKLTGDATLRRAIAQRDNLMGGWDRVVVLGWNFEPAIGQSLDALNDANLEVLVIPPDLLDRLRKKGGIEKLRGQVRFSSLQYLTLKPSRRLRAGDGEELVVTLDNYVLLSPEALNLDEDNRLRLQKVLAAEPLAMIEYWAVDPDYDGQVFRSVWQDYRGNTANDGDALRVVTLARFAIPALQGTRKVCVRAVDVFGFESEVVQDVTEPAR